MPRTAYSQNTYVGGATLATLGNNILNSDTTFTLNNVGSSWATLGSGGGYYLVLDFGNIYEEKVYVPSGNYNYSSGTVTVSGVSRGVDGTTAQQHILGATAAPTLTALDLQEANSLVAQTLGQVTTATSGQALALNGTGIGFANFVFQDIVPIDDISPFFDGAQTNFTINYQGTRINFTNPLSLQMYLSGIPQAWNQPEWVWLSYIPQEGFQVDNNGNIFFQQLPTTTTAQPPINLPFQGTQNPAPPLNNSQTVYPFLATDIMLGY
jgi:hypothetical protein